MTKSLYVIDPYFTGSITGASVRVQQLYELASKKLPTTVINITNSSILLCIQDTPPLIRRVLISIFIELFYLLKTLKREDFFLITDFNPLLFCARKANVCIQIHDVRWRSSIGLRHGSLQYKILSLVIRSYKNILTVSNFSKAELLKLGCASHGISVLYNNSSVKSTVDVSSIEQVTSLLNIKDIQSSRLCILVGTIDSRKNQAMFLDAYLKLLQDTSNCFNIQAKARQFTISFVGRSFSDDYQKTFMSKLAIAQELGFPVYYFESLSQSLLSAMFTVASDFVSCSQYEGFGIPVLDAVSKGIPNIALSDIPPHREIAGNSAVYFSTSDELRETLLAFIEKPVRSRQVSSVKPAFEKFLDRLSSQESHFLSHIY